MAEEQVDATKRQFTNERIYDMANPICELEKVGAMYLSDLSNVFVQSQFLNDIRKCCNVRLICWIIAALCEAAPNEY